MTLRNEEPHVNKCFPRVRGDVPNPAMWILLSAWFSPRARGCSSNTTATASHAHVFPACAGMFRNAPYGRQKGKSFPRVRGDVPTRADGQIAITTFSPRARGCSCYPKIRSSSRNVFPACAGMFRGFTCTLISKSSFPRVRGDVPQINNNINCKKQFSPRARGCSGVQRHHWASRRVFPACAGMFLRTMATFEKMNRFPRVRGDVPPSLSRPCRVFRFSPRARGCSLVF